MSKRTIINKWHWGQILLVSNSDDEISWWSTRPLINISVQDPSPPLTQYVNTTTDHIINTNCNVSAHVFFFLNKGTCMLQKKERHHHLYWSTNKWQHDLHKINIQNTETIKTTVKHHHQIRNWLRRSSNLILLLIMVLFLYNHTQTLIHVTQFTIVPRQLKRLLYIGDTARTSE